MPNPSHLHQSLIALLIWIPVVIWIVGAVHAMIMAELDPLGGIVAIGLALAAGGYAASRPTDPLTPWLVVGVYAGVVLYPVFQRLLHKHEMNKMDVESVARAYEQLSFRPNNLGSFVRIAGILERRGAPEHAIAIVEAAIKGMSAKVVADEARMVRLWKAAHNLRPEITIGCVNCGHANLPGPVYCGRCGAPYLLHFAEKRWMTKGAERKLASVWLASMLGIIAIPMAAYSLPRDLAALTVGGILAIGFLVVLLSFIRRDE